MTKIKKDRPELIVLKFALPCLAMRILEGTLTRGQYNSYEQHCLSGKLVSRKELEKLLPDEHRRRSALAKKLNKPPQDREVVESYWSDSRVGHNSVIDSGEDMYKDNPENLKEFCKVHEATVVSLEGNQRFKVSYNDVSREVIGILTPNVKPGDKVLIHRNFAIYQKINGQYYLS